jgi:hypothetical protein
MTLDNPSNPKKLYCTQVAHVGFNSNNVKIPYFISNINNRLSLPKRLGITTNTLFAPGDMELDPRFEMIAEYRNLRKMKSVRMKDMALTQMYKMMEEGYELHPSLGIEVKALIAWVLRHMDVKFTKTALPKNMNVKVINTIFTLDKVATFFEKTLQKEETQYMKLSGGLPMSYTEGLQVLDRVKLADREVYMNGRAPKFHWDFRPAGLMPPKRDHR